MPAMLRKTGEGTVCGCVVPTSHGDLKTDYDYMYDCQIIIK